MRALNDEIYQTCVQSVEGLGRTAVSSSQPKPQAQKVFGVHLTAMIEDQAKKPTAGGYMLLMQTVLEVFMIHWCSSITEASIPSRNPSPIYWFGSRQRVQKSMVPLVGDRLKSLKPVHSMMV